MVRREFAADVLQLVIVRTVGLALQVEMAFAQQAAALGEIAGAAGGDDIVPGRASAARAGDHVVKGQVFLRAAIGAGEAVPQEHVEAREGRRAVLAHEVAQRDDRRQAQLTAGGAHDAVIFGDDVDPVEEDGFHHFLPRPER